MTYAYGVNLGSPISVVTCGALLLVFFAMVISRALPLWRHVRKEVIHLSDEKITLEVDGIATSVYWERVRLFSCTAPSGDVSIVIADDRNVIQCQIPVVNPADIGEMIRRRLDPDRKNLPDLREQILRGVSKSKNPNLVVAMPEEKTH